MPKGFGTGAFLRSGYLLTALSSCVRSEPQFLPHEHYDMPPLGERLALDRDETANTAGRLAIVADTVRLARGLQAEARGVDRSRRGSSALDRGIDVLTHLVQPDHIDDMARAPRAGSHAIARAIDIDDHTVLTDGVGAGQIEIAIHRVERYPAFLLGRSGRIAIGKIVVPHTQHIQYPRIAYRHGASTTHATALGNKFANPVKQFARILTVVGIKMSLLEMIDHLLTQTLVSQCSYFFKIHILSVLMLLFSVSQ